MSIFTIILAALALGILVFVHELGHYFAARWLGMTVEVFSIGFGKPILKWRVKGVQWQLGWLPFGGYVKIVGMEFAKKEKGVVVDPYDVPNGFFARSPIQRIIVAFAGPLANFILAFILFFLLWSFGGREKPFSDFTQVMGWVDPRSELYILGVRPGDLLTSYNGKPFHGTKDLLYAGMLSKHRVDLNGYHVNYDTGEKVPFSYRIDPYASPQSIEGIQTIGVTALARYMIYDYLPGHAPNPLPEGSPMEGSGIQYGDRLVWADGEYLFSKDQLNMLLTERRALLTVKRGNDVFISRQPRYKAGDLLISNLVRNELIDWQYEVGIRGRWQDLTVLPYNLTADAVVENGIDFIDADTQRAIGTPRRSNGILDLPLQKGDRILAVDGMPIKTAYQLLDLIQTHRALVIVKRQVPLVANTSWNQEDSVFLKSLDPSSIQAIASTIGTEQLLKEHGEYRLLNPVEPKRLDQFSLSEETQDALKKDYEEKLQKISEMKDQKKKALALQILEQSHQLYLLGVPLQDRLVLYNPSPFTLLGNVFSETWVTLKALVMGALHPKWLSGPVGIVQVIHYGWRVGVKEALFWIAAISVNLGFLNLLPIPVLDGGYICLSLWELITRRRIKAKTLERLIVPFVVLMIALLIFLTFQDIRRLF